MRIRKLVVVGLAGIMSFAAQIANAQETETPVAALEGVTFVDPYNQAFTDRIQLEFGSANEHRFENLSPAPWRERGDNDSRDRSYEVALLARGGSGFEVTAAQRGQIGFDAAGDVARESRSAEFRLGRGLISRRDASSQAPTWYLFVASEDEALVWRPGAQRNAFGGAAPSFALQDRVEIGDLQAGITYEAYGIQASIAYVEREISVSAGRHTVSVEERFAGVTVTLRN